MNVRLLPGTFPDDAADRMATLLAELDKWNRRVNLTAVRGRAGLVRNRDVRIRGHGNRF